MLQLSATDRRGLERCSSLDERIAFIQLYRRDPLHWKPPTPLRLAPSVKPTTAALLCLVCEYHTTPTPHGIIKDRNLTDALSRLLLSGFLIQITTKQIACHYQLTATGIHWIEQHYATP
jgi:hypothetical protein